MNQRIGNCIRSLKARDLDALLVSNAYNITYLSGFRNADGYLLLTASGDTTYFTNLLYAQEAKKIKFWNVVARDAEIFTQIAKESKRLRLKRVGFEGKHLPFLEYETILKKCTHFGVELVPTADLLENLRMVKTPSEIGSLRRAAEISREAFEFIGEVYEQIKTEKECSIEIERFLKVRGDNEVAFAPIVASGSRSAFPHHQPGEDILDRKFVLIDLGSKYCGYCADLTRAFFWGKMPRLFLKIHDTVRKAQDAAIQTIKAGIRAQDVDAAAREVIEQAGWGKHFLHGTGHGIGMYVHEPPHLNRYNPQVLKEGMVVTVEPGIYLNNRFGVRREDMVLVKETSREVL